MDIEKRDSLLNLLPWYQDQRFIYHRELVVNKGIHITMYGWPIDLFTVNDSFKCKITDKNMKYHLKGAHKHRMLTVLFDEDGIMLQLWNNKPTLKYPIGKRLQLNIFSWKDIRNFVSWLNRFNR